MLYGRGLDRWDETVNENVSIKSREQCARLPKIPLKTVWCCALRHPPFDHLDHIVAL